MRRPAMARGALPRMVPRAAMARGASLLEATSAKLVAHAGHVGLVALRAWRMSDDGPAVTGVRCDRGPL